MNQAEKLSVLISELGREQAQNIEIPSRTEDKKRLLRALFNMRPPLQANDEFLRIQDEYLREEIARKGITEIADLSPVRDNIYLWQGDITTLKVGAVVNAANNQMLGCFVPCHACIDNAIHTYAGVQLRVACDEFMKEQGHLEETGKAKITPAFNLPSDYVLHTVGPIITGKLKQNDCDLLASCYRSCLTMAQENKIESVAFCCISTGEFHFPNEKAAEIAIQTVTEFIAERQSMLKVIFNVFKQTDYEIYKRILAAD